MKLAPWLCSALATVATLLAGSFAGGCTDDPSRSATDPTSTSTTSDPLPPPPNTCEEPELPPPLDHDAVVGTGTPDSCTEDTLRAAVAGGGNITFDCGANDHTITLGGPIVIAHDTMLDGGDSITLDGLGTSRILSTEARVALTVQRMAFVGGHPTETAEMLASGGAIRVGWLGTLHVFDCVFAGNHAAAEGIEGGGAIYQSNGGELVVVRSTFTDNSAISGGAIDNLLSPMTIVSSTFVNNESFAGGGALYDDGASAQTDDAEGGTIDLCGCRFEGNHTVGQGGAVYLWAYEPDQLIINQCSFVSNSVVRPPDGSALGGAIRTGNAPLQLANSLFAQNHADVHGGAYWTDGEYPVSINNCTFYANVAGVPGREGGYGGALSGFNMTLTNLTFVDNHAEFSGGAISNEGNAFTLRNCILANNTAANQWGLSQSCADTMAGDHNIQWPAPTGDEDPLCTADILVADPLLGTLSDNGGGTETIPLLPASPAIDAGEGCTETDQRGEPRNGPCDIGAFELQ